MPFPTLPSDSLVYDELAIFSPQEKKRNILHGCVIKALHLFYDLVSMATLLYRSFKVPALVVSNEY